MSHQRRRPPRELSMNSHPHALPSQIRVRSSGNDWSRSNARSASSWLRWSSTDVSRSSARRARARPSRTARSAQHGLGNGGGRPSAALRSRLVASCNLGSSPSQIWLRERREQAREELVTTCNEELYRLDRDDRLRGSFDDVCQPEHAFGRSLDELDLVSQVDRVTVVEPSTKRLSRVRSGAATAAPEGDAPTAGAPAGGDAGGSAAKEGR